MIYHAGRIFQLIGFIAMPSAIWVGQFGHDERGAIAIFTASLLTFFLGHLLTRIGKRRKQTFKTLTIGKSSS